MSTTQLAAAARGRAGAHAPWAYLWATLAWSWGFIGLAVVLGRQWIDPVGLGLFAVGAVGPALLASAFVAAGRADLTLRQFWARVVDLRAVPLRWWLAVAVLALGPPVVLGLLAGDPQGLVVPAPAAFLAVGALAGAVEEPGWRGYALEGLQQRRSILSSGFIVGVFWTAWHLPMFLLVGTYQHGLGLWSAPFWAFVVATTSVALIYAWLHNAVRGATVAVVVYHAASNVAGELFPAPANPWLPVVATLILTAAVVATSWQWLRRPVPALVRRPENATCSSGRT